MMNLGHGSELSVIHLAKFTTGGGYNPRGGLRNFSLFLAEDIS